VDNYGDYLSRDRRLVILRILAGVQGYSTNSSILADLLEPRGHRPSRDQIHGDLAWLGEQALVTVEPVGSVHVATVTQRGLDVASGRAHCPGVKRPGPDD